MLSISFIRRMAPTVSHSCRCGESAHLLSGAETSAALFVRSRRRAAAAALSGVSAGRTTLAARRVRRFGCGLVLDGREVNVVESLFFGLEQGSLCGTTGHDVVFDVVAQVGELFRAFPHDVDALDVERWDEVFGHHGQFAPALVDDARIEHAQHAQVDAVALLEFLHHALDGLLEHALDDVFAVHRAVCGDVLRKLLDVHVIVVLAVGV